MKQKRGAGLSPYPLNPGVVAWGPGGMLRSLSPPGSSTWSFYPVSCLGACSLVALQPSAQFCYRLLTLCTLYLINSLIPGQDEHGFGRLSPNVGSTGVPLIHPSCQAPARVWVSLAAVVTNPYCALPRLSLRGKYPLASDDELWFDPEHICSSQTQRNC